MLAFINTTVTKDEIMRQLRAHAAADDIIKGQYWQDGKGCAVGCTIHSGEHIEYESRFGIPQALARLEDCIFEGLQLAEARAWPLRFMSAVEPGADLSRVSWKFLHWLLTDIRVNPGIHHPLVSDAIKQCADVLLPLMKGLPADAAWSAACRANAASAADAACMANAASAWREARAARAARAARDAAWSAASAASAARAASSAACRANAADAARDAASAASAAMGRPAAYSLMAAKLIDLIGAASRSGG
jgi:hypothetical protein